MIKKVLSKLKFYRISKKFKGIGRNVVIEKGNVFNSPENITIGSNVYIGPNGCFIGYGCISIGDGTIIAHNIEIMTRNHNYDSSNLKAIPYDSLYIYKEVCIEENVWIGSNVLIVPGVTIGEGAVIGMGAVVTKNIPKYAVVGGNPAKIIKYRNINKYNELKNNKKTYMHLKKYCPKELS